MPYENFEGDLIRPVEKSVKDGDTLAMRSEIRLVGIDTPETKFSLKETKEFDNLITLSNPKIKEFLRNISTNLRDYLKPKIENHDGTIGTNQFKCGKQATKMFTSIVFDTMQRNATNLLIMTSLEVTDRYGRLIGYVNRKKTKRSGEILAESQAFEKSFNLKMLSTGYAFMYLIYPNLVVEKDDTKISALLKLSLRPPPVEHQILKNL
jgi:endonuclease YncB( thermonuclease family)